MKDFTSDITVIGSGPAGHYAAIQSAKLSKTVIIVEKMPNIGGTCLHSGTIPSKTLREAMIDFTGFYVKEFVNENMLNTMTPKLLMRRLHKVIEKEEAVKRDQLRKNNITLLRGFAEFVDDKTLKVFDDEGNVIARVSSEIFIIATGSKPRHPIEVPFDDEVILDSTQLLKLEKIPDSMIVLGGGVIGSEYASFFSIFGTKVTIVDQKDRMLPLLDSEISFHLQKELGNIGLQFEGSKVPKRIENENKRARVTFEDGTELSASVLFCALGRIAAVDGLNLQNVGISLSNRMFIPVNAIFQTEAKNIYAAGDVVGNPALASTAMEQGRLAARYACGAKVNYMPHFHPIGIYTIPEIASYGYSENQLRDMKIDYEVGRAYYYEISRSQISADYGGLFKILFHPQTLTILGVHIIGKKATEVIHIAQVAMTLNVSINYFIEHVFNYPTYAEGYRIAAFNGLNKIKENEMPFY